MKRFTYSSTPYNGYICYTTFKDCINNKWLLNHVQNGVYQYMDMSE